MSNTPSLNKNIFHKVGVIFIFYKRGVPESYLSYHFSFSLLFQIKQDEYIYVANTSFILLVYYSMTLSQK